MKYLRNFLIKALGLKHEIIIKDEKEWNEYDEAQLSAFLNTETGRKFVSKIRMSAMELSMAGHVSAGQGVMMTYNGIINMSESRYDGRDDKLFSYEVIED